MAERRRLDVEHLAVAQRAAKVAGASTGEWWKSLSDAADTTTTEQSLDELLRDSIVAMGRALEVDTVAVLLANAAGDELVARASTGLDEEAALGLGIRAGQGMASWVLQNKRPLIVADLSKIDVVSPGLRNSGLRSIVAVPVLAEDHPLGVLYAGTDELDHFNASDVGMLELLADRLAGAIARVQFFETERAARSRAEQLADRIARIQRVTARLAATGTAGEVATALIEWLGEEHGDAAALRWTSVWLLDDDVLVPIGPAAPATNTPALGPLRLDGEHPVAVAAREAAPAYFGDPDDRRFPVLAKAFPSSSFAVVPIVLANRCLGVLAAVYRGRHNFDDQEREFLDAVVGQVAQALERARLSSTQEQLAEISAFFARAAKVLAEGSDLADTLDRLASVSLPVLGDICLIDVATEEGRIVRMVAKHRDSSRQYLVDRLRTRYPPQAGGPHPAASVLDTGETRWAPEMSDAFMRATTQDEAHLSLIKMLGFRSYISVPLRHAAETLGSVTLVSVTRSFGPKDVSFAEQLAEQVAAVVQKARRYDIAVQTSHILQSSLLPKGFPNVEGLAVHTRYVAASEGLEVGGDFYDVVPMGQRRVAFMIGDVAGHDGDAAALMGQLRSSARTLVGRVGAPSTLIKAIQESWTTLDFDRMATVVVGELDVATGELAMASAGHYPPLVLDARSSHYVPVAPSTPLGVRGPGAVDWRGTLEVDQVLLLYTDGAIDERTKGCDRSMRELAGAVVEAAGDSLDLASICDAVVAVLSPERVDDVALLALKLDSPRRANP